MKFLLCAGAPLAVDLAGGAVQEGKLQEFGLQTARLGRDGHVGGQLGGGGRRQVGGRQGLGRQVLGGGVVLLEGCEGGAVGFGGGGWVV